MGALSGRHSKIVSRIRHLAQQARRGGRCPIAVRVRVGFAAVRVGPGRDEAEVAHLVVDRLLQQSLGLGSDGATSATSILIDNVNLWLE